MTQSSPLSSPGLLWRNAATPVSGRFGDVYFSAQDGLAESRHVFLDGCGVPEAWQGSRCFVIGETGFGTGLNFLNAWALWRCHGPADGRLHFLSVEAYPLSARDLRLAHKPWPELASLSTALLERYDQPLPGFHRLHFDEDRVHLTLLHGDAAVMLGELEAQIDAWFLDGFSPARNPSMWSEAVFREMARLSRQGARLATFTVAGAVRQGLSHAGFAVEKAPGFGRKRDMLKGRFTGPPGRSRLPPWFASDQPSVTADKATVVGGGIAGASLSAALARRGLAVTLIEAGPSLAMGASGNPAGIVMPRLTVDPTPAGDFHTAAFAYARHAALASGAAGDGLEGVVQLARDEADWRRFLLLVMGQALPPAWLRFVTKREASARAGIALTRPGLFYPAAGSIHPPSLVRWLARDARIETDTRITGIRQTDRSWHLTTGRADQTGTHETPFLLLATGMEALNGPDCGGLPLRASLGQITTAPAPDGLTPRTVVTYGGYLTPAVDGLMSIGATYDPLPGWPQSWRQVPDDGRHRRNLDLMAPMAPQAYAALRQTDLAGRAAIRATTPDHLPIAGPVPVSDAFRERYAALRYGQNQDALPSAPTVPAFALCTGLGSRGLVTAPILGELIASQLLGDPWPLPRTLAQVVHPARFLVRALKRNTVSA